MAHGPTSSSRGSTVLVTGASSGIGAELARELAARGYGVTLTPRRADRCAELGGRLEREHGVPAAVEPCDLADAGAREALVDRLRAGEREVVGVCNNAGRGSAGPFRTLALEPEAELVRINVEALHHLTGAFLPRMVSQGVGAVLNVASLAGFQPRPRDGHLLGDEGVRESRSPRRCTPSCRPSGVSVTCLAPGPVHTEFGPIAGREGADIGRPSRCSWRRRTWRARPSTGWSTGRRIGDPGRARPRRPRSAGGCAPRSLLRCRLVSRSGFVRVVIGRALTLAQAVPRPGSRSRGWRAAAAGARRWRPAGRAAASRW